MSEIAFFDANACFGRAMWRTPGAPYDKKTLLDALDHFRIGRAMVYHAQARDLESLRGNELLLESLKDEPRFVLQAVFNPAPYRDGFSAEDQAMQIVEQGFKSVRVFPLMHGVALRSRETMNALAVLEEAGLPLFLDYDQVYYNTLQLGQHEQRAVNLDEVAAIAQELPCLTVVPVGTNYNHLSKLYRVFDSVGNVVVETSLLQGLNCFTFICERWGAERLIFGSGMPIVSAGAARAMIMYADISDDDKRTIASGNLEKLLGEEKTETVPVNGSRLRVLLTADRGEPVTEIEINDIHGHISEKGMQCLMGTTLGPQDSTLLVERLDRVGIDRLAVAHWQIYSGDAPSGNRDAWEQAEKYPGRILPYMVVNPNYPEDWQEQQAECFERRRFFGLKPYPFTQRCKLSDPKFADALAFADKLKLPILCHMAFEPLGGITFAEIDKLAPMYPGAQFVLAHAGGSYRLADGCIECAQKYVNVWLEINYTSVPYGIIRYLVDRAGVGKVLFGTDSPMRDPAPVLGWVLYDGLTHEELVSVLGANMREICRISGYEL